MCHFILLLEDKKNKSVFCMYVREVSTLSLLSLQPLPPQHEHLFLFSPSLMRRNAAALQLQSVALSACVSGSFIKREIRYLSSAAFKLFIIITHHWHTLSASI
jgi:hypothetical protein